MSAAIIVSVFIIVHRVVAAHGFHPELAILEVKGTSGV